MRQVDLEDGQITLLDNHTLEFCIKNVVFVLTPEEIVKLYNLLSPQPVVEEEEMEEVYEYEY